jgi:hypothetical protein
MIPLGVFKSPLMFGIVGKFDRRPALRSSRWTLLSSSVLTLLLLCFGFVSGSATAEEARHVLAAPVGVGSQFAISDFDGDLHPDLVSVQAGRTASGNTDYWIQLQLSAAGRQSIRLVAPAGGLLIEARDVNGDHAVDLILYTSLRQPVAIFLNDGRGSFARVAPSAFPGDFSKPLTNWASTSDQATDSVGVPPQSRSAFYRTAKALTIIQSHRDPIASSVEGFSLDSFLASHAGRAPPV